MEAIITGPLHEYADTLIEELPRHAAELESNGFTVIRGFFDGHDILDEIEKEITAIGIELVGPEFEFTKYDTRLITTEIQSRLYDRLHYLTGLSRLSGSKYLLGYLQLLGIRTPGLMGCCNMRYDVPKSEKHLFHWHQDTLYLLGSLNAVTVWVPFGPADTHHGSVEMAVNGHKQGISPFKQISDKKVQPDVKFLQRDLSIDMEVTHETHAVVAKRGDIVVFRQMALHRSIYNHSDRPRWSAQIRVSDLSCDWFKNAGYPMGNRTNIFYCDYPGFKHERRQV